MGKSRGFNHFIPVFLMVMLLSALAFAAGNKNVVNFINEACRSLSAGAYDDCISSCNKAIAIDPACAAAYYTRGFTYRYKGDYDQSISDFNKAIQIDSEYAAAYYGRAKSYYYKREYDKAWEDLYKARGLGCKAEDEFLRELRKASGRKE
ncbi:MAG: tetratricopeptide repeat protein [Candidatus Omnitrophota bacterium]|nr:tetratricopeptide repeat protein [Candidatus Omnitrophota bacterium]